MKRVLTVGLALLTTACATTYGELGGLMDDGVTAEQLTADSYRIRSRGNGSTDPVLVHDHGLLRAAETTKLACATHFIVEAGEDRTTIKESYTPATETHRVEKVKDKDGKEKEVVHVTRTEESYSTTVRPGADFYIRAIRLAPGAAAPEGAMSADEVLMHVGPRVKRRRSGEPIVFPLCPDTVRVQAGRF